MKCPECNRKITPEDIICPHCKIKTPCKIYKRKPQFYIIIIFSIIVICITTTFLIAGLNTLYIILIIIISMISIIWGLNSWLTKFHIDNEGITYYNPLKKSVTLKWDEIDEFTVYKENAKKTIFPKKIYTLKSTDPEKSISFPEMKHTMEGYSRFMANIYGKTKKYPRNIN